MKKYFAKYLPVEGEIKEGDKFLADGRIYTFFGFDGAKSSVNTVESGYIYHSANNSAREWLSKLKKVKLFLCSRDVMIGDKAYHHKAIERGSQEIKNGQYDDLAEWEGENVDEADLFKVIGEISPSLGLQEGQEFTTEEAKALGILD